MKLFRPPLSLACLLLLSVVVAPASGSDALLQMSTISVANDLKLTEGAFRTMTIYQSHKDPTQYYYLPANIRFATNDSGERMFTVYKYNLAYDNANRRYLKPAEQKELDAKLQSNPQLGELYQGGLLKATFSFGLRPGELETMRSALSTFLGSSNFKLGRLPINKASFTFELVDPEDSTGQGKVILGPFTAPVSDDVISVLTPLSRSATDVLSAIVTCPTFGGQRG